MGLFDLPFYVIHLGWAGPRVRVGSAEASDFRAVRGEDVRDQLVEVLTGLDRTYVRNLGGAEFVDAATGRVLRRWPQDQDDGTSGNGKGHG